MRGWWHIANASFRSRIVGRFVRVDVTSRGTDPELECSYFVR